MEAPPVRSKDFVQITSTSIDREIFVRAFDVTWSAVKDNILPSDFDSDEGLEAILRRELIEIACFNSVSDPETLRDVLLARLMTPE